MNEPEQREEAVFEAALQLPADQRGSYLDKTCAGDPETRRRVEVLLGAFERAGGFLNQSAAPGSPRRLAISRPPSEKPGDRIGRYKLLEQIGEGGCGLVYVAEQEEPVRRRVALKVIKLGMDTKQVIARFDAERQALALMDHPNIAKVLDASATETGRPYFVMELVRGIKITDYCDQKQLSLPARLDLFTQVCRAIQHAHQKGVIHRDIKPSNILVTPHDGVPVPKVIDFGIAKATQGRLTDQTVYTAFEQFIGTPAYMSPEQAEMCGLDIDTRSDIYSLGVLLYELLTGKTPFDAKALLGAGLDSMRRTIREVEPVKPSTRLTQALEVADASRPRGSFNGLAIPTQEELTSDSRGRLRLKEQIARVRGDLDWIVMKCLEKDRTRRYETANGLAADIQRHLDDEPVSARRPGRFYRLQKAIRRNRGAFAATTAIAIVLLLGVVVSTLEAVRARRAEGEQVQLREQAQAGERKATTEAAKSQQVADFLKKMLARVGPSQARGRDTTMLREILDETAERVGKDLTNQPEVEVELCLTLASAYHDLGLYQQMERVARHSLQLARTRLSEENESVADSLTSLADALMHFGQLHLGEIHPTNLVESESRLHDLNLEEAEQCCRKSLAMSRKLLGNENPKVASALNLLANVLETQGRWVEAETTQREALAMQRKLLGNENPKVAKLLYELAAFLALQDNRLAEAENMNREALAMQRKLLGTDHPEIAKSLFDLADVLENQGKLAEAETTYREVVAMWRKLHADDRIDMADALNHLALLLMQEGKLAEAETLEREALAMLRRLLGNEHPAVADSVNSLTIILQRQGKLAEGKALIEGPTTARKEEKPELR